MEHKHCTRAGTGDAGITTELSYELYYTGDKLNILSSTEKVIANKETDLDYRNCKIITDITKQSPDIALGVDVGEKARLKVSAQFTKSASVSPGSGTSAEDIDNIVLVSGEADSISAREE